MILLDTNVLSELMRPAIAPAVAAFIRAQAREELFTASLCEAELRYGITRLPASHRRDELEAAFRTFITTGFAGRVLAFDSACAEAYAILRVRREAAGLPISIPDALIAGTALAHGATVATRNVGDFSGCGLTVIDPWQAVSCTRP
jgi:predicted nucleic acid-binding protein